MVKRIKATENEKQLVKLLEGTDTYDTKILSQRANEISFMVSQVIEKNNGKKTMRQDKVALLLGMTTLVGYLKGKVELISKMTEDTESYTDYIG